MSAEHRQATTVIFDAHQHACPACGARDRWEGRYLETPTKLVIWCDCGTGELVLVLAAPSDPSASER